MLEMGVVGEDVGNEGSCAKMLEVRVICDDVRGEGSGKDVGVGSSW